MEEANNPQERTVSFASQSDSVRTAQSIESKTLESATLARRPVSRLINPKPVLSSVSKTARDVSKRISLVQKQVRSGASKHVTLAQEQVSGALKGVQQVSDALKGAKDRLFTKQQRDHKFLLAPMTAVTYREYICRGRCKSGPEIRLDDKIEDIVRAEATMLGAMEHLVPTVKKGRPSKMEENVCFCCGGDKTANPGYDFLFNRQKFKSLLIIQLSMFFMTILVLNYEQYMIKAPSCHPVEVDNFMSRLRLSGETYNANYVNSSVSHSREKIVLVPRKQPICPEMLKPLDAFGFCNIIAEYEWFLANPFETLAPLQKTPVNPFLGFVVVSLLGYFFAFISLHAGRKLFYDYNAKERRCVGKCLILIVRLDCWIGYVLYFLFVQTQLHNSLRVCGQGLFNTNCFLRNGTVVSTKAQAGSYYQDFKYIYRDEYKKIEVGSQESSNITLAITTGVVGKFKAASGLLEENFSKCVEFQYDGHLVVVYGIWLVLTVLFYISNLSVLISMIEYLKPGFIIVAKRKMRQLKNAAFKDWNATAKARGLLFKIERRLPTACKSKGPYLWKGSNAPGKKREKVGFQFPPIVGAAVLLTVVGLFGIFVQYWVWQVETIEGFLTRCAVPSLERAHDIAKDPKVTNSSQLLHQVLGPCAPYIDYGDLEAKFFRQKGEFFSEASEYLTNGSAIAKENMEELRANAVSRANAASPDLVAQILNLGADAGAQAQGIAKGVPGIIIQTVQSGFQNFANNNFNLVKQILGNNVVGKVIIGQVVAQILLIWSAFGKIVLIICAILRFRSMQRMLNKLYVIGVRQCEVVERCFVHEEGVYVFPMNHKDLDALNGEAPESKIITNNCEIFGANIRMPHLEVEELSQEEKRKAQEKRLEYRHIHDVNYFLPGFVISQLLGSIIQFYVLWIGLSLLYFAVVLNVAQMIVMKPEGGVRSFDTEEDILEGLGVMRNKLFVVLLSVCIPFFLKGVILKQFGKYWSDRKSGIKAPKRFILINFLQMVSFCSISTVKCSPKPFLVLTCFCLSLTA